MARTVLRLLRAPAIVLVVYLLLRVVFDRLTEHDGLLTPGGSVKLGVVLLGAAVLVLRVVVLFGLPAWVAYRGVARVLDRSAPR
jgi:hypothetical protein